MTGGCISDGIKTTSCVSFRSPLWHPGSRSLPPGFVELSALIAENFGFHLWLFVSHTHTQTHTHAGHADNTGIPTNRWRPSLLLHSNTQTNLRHSYYPHRASHSPLPSLYQIFKLTWSENNKTYCVVQKNNTKQNQKNLHPLLPSSVYRCTASTLQRRWNVGGKHTGAKFTLWPCCWKALVSKRRQSSATTHTFVLWFTTVTTFRIQVSWYFCLGRTLQIFTDWLLKRINKNINY